jgi:hypothetical protein
MRLFLAGLLFSSGFAISVLRLMNVEGVPSASVAGLLIFLGIVVFGNEMRRRNPALAHDG